ncbi:MAG: CHRD domain-containing protein [Myxococcales bacterium]|nr:CHRD domain-containing protein [Myxococcales bacterium]
MARLTPTPSRLRCSLQSASITGPTCGGASAKARAQSERAAAGDATIAGAASGLSGPITAATIHRVGAGTDPLLFSIPVTGPGTFGGALGPLSSLTLARVRAGDTYVSLATAAHPAGEVRGPLVASMLEYGEGCPGPNGPVRLSATGLPTPGGTIHGTLDGGNPGNGGLVFRSLVGGALPVGWGCLLHTAPPLAPAVPVVLDANGRIDVAKPILPGIPTPCRVSAQFFGFDPGAPNGFLYASNGLVIDIQD